MNIKTVYIAVVLLVMLSFVASICFYPHLPDQMATHWSASNTPNDYMSRPMGAFFIPLLTSLVVGIEGAIFYGLISVSNNKYVSRMFLTMLLSLTVFFFASNILILLYNVGININMTLWGFVLLTIMSVAILYSVIMVAVNGRTKTNQTSTLTALDNVPQTYSDKLVEITNDSIMLFDYYFPIGRKTIPFSKIEYIRILNGGSMRIWGSDDFRTWYGADADRMSRDYRFVIHLKNKWSRSGFTVEDSNTVYAILNNKGLIKQL